MRCPAVVASILLHDAGLGVRAAFDSDRGDCLVPDAHGALVSEGEPQAFSALLQPPYLSRHASTSAHVVDHYKALPALTRRARLARRSINTSVLRVLRCAGLAVSLVV